MANYTSVTVSSYNSSPPSDDGSTDSTNRITWAGIKTKLADPLNTAIASINSNIVTAGGTWDNAAPQGTAGVFAQTAAPTGWTKSTTHNDKALRVVSGTASSGGSTAFTSVFTSRTIAAANLPTSITHSLSVGTSLSAATASTTGNTNTFCSSNCPGSTANAVISLNASGAALSSGTVSGTIGGSGTAMDFAVQYVDVIIATKD